MRAKKKDATKKKTQSKPERRFPKAAKKSDFIRPDPASISKPPTEGE
jgi:hypothetical protein